MKKRFRVHSIGQISEADIKFGDLTIMVGPQATGKSILFQLFKLTQDAGVIKQTIKKHGFDWHTSGNGKQEGNWKSFLSLYFGEGMDSLWTPGSNQPTRPGGAQEIGVA